MKLAVAAAALMLFAPAAYAQTAPAQTAPASKFNLDTPVETIAADEKGKVALESAVPGITAHPMWDSFKSMSLNQLQPMSNGQLTDDMMKKAAETLAGVK